MSEPAHPADLTPDTSRFLRAAAQRAGLPIKDVLASVLRPEHLCDFPESERLTARLDQDTRDVVDSLDWALRVANPGTQVVFREKFIGYRRVDARPPPTSKATRSEFYACLIPRQSRVRVTMPLRPTDYAHVTGVMDLSGTGHHGVGDLAVEVASTAAVDQLVADFDNWLGPRW